MVFIDMGLRPYAFNEMTMLSFYRYHVGGQYELAFVPVIPYGADVRRPFDNAHWYQSYSPIIT
jgi:hypothetical protein